MKKYVSLAVCATAMLLSCVAVDAILAPASAQSDNSVDFNTFHDQLASYGDWVYSDRWGEVWLPDNVPVDFHPYGTGGHWGYTDDYGWTWVSDYEWGDIPFHYGRWVNDPDDGWLWIPGYVWSPGWVIWRSNGQYTGWMPMPPDEAFLNGGGPSVGISLGGDIGVSIDFNNTGDYYGYSQWYGSGYGENSFAANWVFVGTGHISDRDYSRYEAPAGNYTTIIHNTTNITNYTVVNNYIVNKSVNVQVFEKASGHPVQKLTVSDVIRKPQFITHVDAGRAIQTRMRAEVPRGNGHAGSAPKPSPQIVQSLSQKVAPHNGKQPAHLFTRTTVTSAPLAKAPPTTAPIEKASPTAAPPGKTPPSKTEPTGPGAMAHHDNEKATTPTGPASRPTKPAGEMKGTGASPEGPTENKTHAHAPGGETPMTTPSSTTPSHGTTGTERSGTPPQNTEGERPARHETPTVAPKSFTAPENNGGMGHASNDATMPPKSLESAPVQHERKTMPTTQPATPPSGTTGGGEHSTGSATREEHVPAHTAAPNKPAPPAPTDEKKPKHDETDKPQ
jgi:hypothetical protein